uniref:Lysosome-associated membrane glycoprotein 1 n=1 Tax=Bursaphelenchus xylophilus TaxID=6326 RepID=A0A1I7SFA9_BURXY
MLTLPSSTFCFSTSNTTVEEGDETVFLHRRTHQWNYILIKFSEERCIQPYPEVIDYLNNTYVKYLYNPKGRSTSKNVTIATVEEEPLNKAALGGGIAGALVFLLLLIGLTVFLIRRYRNKQYR